MKDFILICENCKEPIGRILFDNDISNYAMLQDFISDTTYTNIPKEQGFRVYCPLCSMYKLVDINRENYKKK